MEKKEIKIVKKGITQTKVVDVIPAQEVIQEVEVDTLQEFLKEVELSEEELRIAVKAYKDDKVSQPSYDMNDVLSQIKKGEEGAEKYINSTEKELVIRDPNIADALANSGIWTCVAKKTGPQYIFRRT